MANVLIIWNKLLRDMRPNESLGKYISKFGHNVKTLQFTDRDIEVFGGKADIIFTFPPSIPFLYNLLLKFKQLGKYIVCHPCEGFRTYPIYPGNQEYSLRSANKQLAPCELTDDFRLDIIDKYCFWGQHHMAYWAPYLVSTFYLNKSAVVQTGSIYLNSVVRWNPSEVDSYYSGLSKDNALWSLEKKRILFISGACTYADYSDTDFNIAQDISSKVLFDKWRESSRLDRAIVANALFEFARSLPMGWSLDLKLHPVELELMEVKNDSLLTDYAQLIGLANVNLLTRRNLNQDYVDLCAFSIHYGSTMALELALDGVPSFLLVHPYLSSLSRKELITGLYLPYPHELFLTPEALVSYGTACRLSELIELCHMFNFYNKRFAHEFYSGNSGGMEAVYFQILKEIVN